MSVLVFPDSPVNGQLYPPTPIPGVNQYQWSSATNTWEIVDPNSIFIPKSIIDATGDLIVGELSDVPAVLPVGNDGDVLVADSGELLGVKWGTPPSSGIPESLIDAKGDLIVGQISDTAARLPVGNDGEVLVADSAEILGVKWEVAPTSGIPESIIQAKGDLIVGSAPSTPDILPSGVDGYVLTLDSAQTLGVKWAAAPGNPTSTQTQTHETIVLAPGQLEDFWLDLGQFFSLISFTVTASPEDTWIRAYTSEAGLLADTRIVPGPPFPSPNTGFVTEVVTSSSSPTVVLLPAPNVYSDNGLFIRIVNQSAVTQSFTLETKYLQFVQSTCDLPPYYCNPYVSTSCVTSFTTITGQLQGFTPYLVYTGGTTILSEAGQNYNGSVSGGSGALGQFSILRDYLGSIGTLQIDFGSGYQDGDNITILGSLIGGTDGIDDIYIALSLYNGLQFEGAWQSCYGLTSFPTIDSSSVTTFVGTWFDCVNLTSFPLIDTSSGTSFWGAWSSCLGLTSFPAIDTSSGTIFDVTWANCTGLTSFPLLDLSSGTSFGYTWSSCIGLTSFPPVDVSSGIYFSYTWSDCPSLTSFPTLNVSSGVYFSGSWNACSGLTSFPLLDVSSGIKFDYAWAYCTGLTSFPALDVSSGTDFLSSWAHCTSLTSFPLINTSSGVEFGVAWAHCTSLTSFPLINTSSGIIFGYSWNNCSSLTSFPPLDFSSGLYFESAWASCTSLTSFPPNLFDSCPSNNFSYAWKNCALDQISVDNILTSLDTSGQTGGIVDISNGTSSAPGPSGLAAKASLIAKGWTVTTN